VVNMKAACGDVGRYWKKAVRGQILSNFMFSLGGGPRKKKARQLEKGEELSKRVVGQKTERQKARKVATGITRNYQRELEGKKRKFSRKGKAVERSFAVGVFVHILRGKGPKKDQQKLLNLN